MSVENPDAGSPYNRAAHKGTQPISSVTGLQTALDLKLEAADMQSETSG